MMNKSAVRDKHKMEIKKSQALVITAISVYWFTFSDSADKTLVVAVSVAQLSCICK